MWEGLKKSLNTMYYEIGEYKNQKAGITMNDAKILNMAGQLGVTNIWPGADLRQSRVPPGADRQQW